MPKRYLLDMSQSSSGKENSKDDFISIALDDVICTDYAGFQKLTRFYRKIYYSANEYIALKLPYWLDANMSGPLGGLIDHLESQGKNIVIDDSDARKELVNVLTRNNFLPTYGGEPKNWKNVTSIEFRRFKDCDHHLFKEYVNQQFRTKQIPQMSPSLWKRFNQGLDEIFENARYHSQTKQGIIICGQEYPQSMRIEFTITDLGVGFRHNVSEYLQRPISDEVAINWAMEAKNTTKQNITGGIGLKDLRAFITKNGGKIQIISDRGYWELTKFGTINMRLLEYSFPGTVVNIEINTADTNLYIEDDIPDEDLF